MMVNMVLDDVLVILDLSVTDVIVVTNIINQSRMVCCLPVTYVRQVTSVKNATAVLLVTRVKNVMNVTMDGIPGNIPLIYSLKRLPKIIVISVMSVCQIIGGTIAKHVRGEMMCHILY